MKEHPWARGVACRPRRLYAETTVATEIRPARAKFDPGAFESFRFTARDLDERGHVTLRYSLDDAIAFTEVFDLPLGDPARRLDDAERERVDGLLALLHWVAGVSYFKTALPPQVSCETGTPPPAVAALLEALYSEGLAELAFTNARPSLPRPAFAGGASSTRLATAAGTIAQPADTPQRVLVPVGGGKDSAVALEIVRRSGVELALFSIGDAPPIARTVGVAELPRLLARRTLDPGLPALNASGAINGHVPITAIVSCVALLSAALNGFDAVAMANERSASAGNVVWDGVEVNHQFSKGLRAEQLLRAALAESASGMQLFSVLRPASELAIARAFARMQRYHGAFTSCNAIFRIDPALRAASWCCDCPKCRFVFLALAPFSEPAHLREIFGCDLLDEERQFEGFALLTATGGHKPFECVGEEQESLAAMRLLAEDERWREHRVVRRLAAEVLPRFPAQAGDPDAVLALSDEHAVPAALLAEVRAVLGA
jgi:UDP-N-acetyl-alpha-D-muramoyl-L-alanyl-L-glutamate epimerase